MKKYIPVLILLIAAFGGCNSSENENVTDGKVSIQPVMVSADKPFLPQEIVENKIAIGTPMKDVRSVVNYLREADGLPLSYPNYVISTDDMSSRCYFNSIKISYKTSYFQNVVDEIFLTQRIKDKSEESFEWQNKQFIQYCYESFGEPVKKYTKKMQMYKSKDHTYSSCILWIVDEQTIVIRYYSKLMREDLIKFMGEKKVENMFGVVRISIKPKQEGEAILEEIRQLELEDSEYRNSMKLYLDDFGNAVTTPANSD